MKEPVISDNQWWNIHKEFTSYFDEMRSFELQQIREDMFDFHYSLLSEDEDEYQSLYKELIHNQDFIHFSERVHILELMSTKIYWHKRIIDNNLRYKSKLKSDSNPDISILVNSLIELMNDMSNKYIHREDLSAVQNHVNELIFQNRRQLRLCVESIILFHSLNRDWKLISKFSTLLPHNIDNKKVYYLALVHKAFLKSLDDVMYTILDMLISQLNMSIAKKKNDLERDDELNLLFTLLTGYLKHPSEIRFFLKNRRWSKQFKKAVRKDIRAFVFEENDNKYLPPFFDSDNPPD